MEERAKAGAGALSGWLRKCRALTEEIKGVTFKRLVEVLVDLVLLYGVDVWGCTRQLGPVENVQMRAARILMAVGRLHPLVSPQFEMNTLAVKWEAIRRSLDEVVREAMKVESKVKWMRDLIIGLKKFGWRGLDTEALSGLSMNEVKALKDTAWRRARECWRE